MKFPRDEQPSNLHALHLWISAWATQNGVAQDRAQRWLAFEFIAAAFEAAHLDNDHPLFVLKGGYAMEVRLGLRARATKDIDATIRADATPQQITQAVTDALAVVCCDGAATFDVRAARQIGTVHSVKFDVRVLWYDRSFAKIQLEVSADEADAAREWDLLKLPGRAAEFGITDVPSEAPCLPLRFQVAQKLHAVTHPRDKNDRFRDLIDLQLLDAVHDHTRDSALLDACHAVFSARSEHSWPPQVVVRDRWETGYTQLAAELELPNTNVHDAAAYVNALIARLNTPAD